MSVFSLLRKTCNDGDDRTDSGKLFQTDAVVAGKVRSPMVERTLGGTTSADVVEKRSRLAKGGRVKERGRVMDRGRKRGSGKEKGKRGKGKGKEKGKENGEGEREEGEGKVKVSLRNVGRTDTKAILYPVQCSALHWTDNY